MNVHSDAHLSPTENRMLGELGQRVMIVAGLLGMGGVLASAVIGAVDTASGWERFFRSYLVAFVFITSLSLGSFFFVFVQHLTRAGWSVTVRRIAEAIASNLIWLWVLFLPILLLVVTGHGALLFRWADPDIVSHFSAGKQAWFSESFWAARAIVCMAIWAGMTWFFFRSSVEQDHTGEPELTVRMQSVAAPAAILFALTSTLAIIDWVMALEPRWFSTMFGVYFFSASCCGAFAFLILVIHLLKRTGRLTHSISIEHIQDLGKLLFAFGIVFWAYIAFSQYMLIWYANIPEETIFFMTRQMGGWQWVSLLLIVGHFFGPFLAIMSRHMKRHTAILAAAAVWMLAMHYLDLYWLAMPRVPMELLEISGTLGQLKQAVESAPVGEASPVGYGWHLLDLTCLIGLLGLYVAVTAWRLRNVSLVAVHDPRLPEALAFENI